MLQPLRLCSRASTSLLRPTTISATLVPSSNDHPLTSRLRNQRNFHTSKPTFKASLPNQAMDFVRNAIGENLGGVAQKLSTHQFSLEEVPDQDGKVAVITGGTEGIGYGCTHTLLSKNISKVFVISLREEVRDTAIKDITSTISAEAAGKLHWIQCDIADWPAVKRAAEEIASKTDRIDIIINNASRGIMTYQLTDYGVDRHMAVNHMGHAVLTSHLMPLLKKTAETHGGYVRIVNMASNAHQATPSDCKFEGLDELNQDLGPNGNYGRSKLAAILYSRYLAKHLTSKNPKILANATHPGFVSTKQSKVDIHEPYPILGYGMSVLFDPFKKSTWQGCVPLMYASTVTEKSGEYICPPAVPEEGTSQSQDEALGERMMELTRELVKEKAGDELVFV